MQRSLCSVVSLLLLSTLASAEAQQQPSEVAEKTASSANSGVDKKKEVIRVTGSRIKRVDVEGPTQVQTVSKEEMEAAGQTTVSDALREIPAATAGATREESNRGAPGFSGVNLRGIGEKYTLVLIDGQRLPLDPSFDAVDVGAIPAAMIERIEILKEGAGAIYGSDAVGGVVNIITKKAFDGTSVLYSRAQPSGKGGIEDRLEAVTGKTFDRGSWLLVGSYRARDLIMAKNRNFIGEGWSNSGAPGSFQAIENIGTDSQGAPIYKAKGEFAADPACPNNGTSRVNDNDSGVFCQYNYESVRAISPKLSDLSLMAKAEYEVNDTLAAYGLMKTTLRKAQDLVAPAPTDGAIDITKKEAVSNIKKVLGAAGANIDPEAGDGVRIRYRTVPLGLRDSRTNDTSNFAVLGLKGQLAEGWEWDLAHSYGQVLRTETTENGFWLKDRMTSIISEGLFNPFDPNDSGAALEAAEYRASAKQSSQSRQTTLNFTGSVGSLPAGSVQLAVGASQLSEDFNTDADPEILAGNVQGSAAGVGSGRRKTSAIYTEASIPLLEELELNAAARYDHYQKYGNTLNPRLALKYRLGDVLFRGSLGTGFRAPTLQEEGAGEGTSFPPFLDHVQCDAKKASGDAAGISFYCAEQQYAYRSKEASDVKPEKVFIYSLGAVYSPSLESNLSLDFWTAKIKDRIGVPDLSQLTRLEADGNKVYGDKGISIERDPDSGDINEISAPAANLSANELSGLDLTASLILGSKKTASFEYSLDGAYQVYNRVAAFEGSPLLDQSGTARLPRFRTTNSIGTTFLSDHRVNLIARSTGAMKKVNENLGKTPLFTSYDLHYTFTALSDGTLALGVLNFANLNPPKDESANPTINFNLYGYAGRSVYVRVTQNF